MERVKGRAATAITTAGALRSAVSLLFVLALARYTPAPVFEHENRSLSEHDSPMAPIRVPNLENGQPSADDSRYLKPAPARIPSSNAASSTFLKAQRIAAEAESEGGDEHRSGGSIFLRLVLFPALAIGVLAAGAKLGRKWLDDNVPLPARYREKHW